MRQTTFIIRVAAVLNLWIAVTVALSVAGVFRGEAFGFPLALVLAVVLPPVVFVAAYRVSPRFRELMLSLDIGIVTLFQVARIAGLVFLVLYYIDELPGLFAIAAGSGDAAIGLTAPFVALGLVALSPFPRRAFVAWNLLGVLDLVVAVTLGVLSSQMAVGVLADDVTTALVQKFPLSFIPTFGVPFTLIMHLIALLQVREGRELSAAPLLRGSRAGSHEPATG
jgi:hypothetical protein